MAGKCKSLLNLIFGLVKEESSLCCPKEGYVVNKPSEVPPFMYGVCFQAKYVR